VLYGRSRGFSNCAATAPGLPSLIRLLALGLSIQLHLPHDALSLLALVLPLEILIIE